MNSLRLIVILAFILVVQSCRPCQFSGYGCSTTDNSTILLDSELYRFRDEDMRYTRMNENDSLIWIDYSISRKGNITNSNVNIGFGFILHLEFRKKTISDFELKSGTVEFIRNNVWGDFYTIDSHTIEVVKYEAGKCSEEIGNSLKTPEYLDLIFRGIISKGNEQKNIEFHIRAETKKVEIEDC